MLPFSPTNCAVPFQLQMVQSVGSYLWKRRTSAQASAIYHWPRKSDMWNGPRWVQKTWFRYWGQKSYICLYDWFEQAYTTSFGWKWQVRSLEVKSNLIRQTKNYVTKIQERGCIKANKCYQSISMHHKSSELLNTYLFLTTGELEG